MQTAPVQRVSAEEVRRRLAPLRRSRLLGAASLAAYESLYHQAGCRAGRVRFTAESLGAEFGRDRRTAWDWIGALIASRLLAIHGREERTGLIDADVADPADALLGRIEGDPQSTFEFAQDGATERNDGARGFLHENPRAPEEPGICAGVFARKPPRPSEAADPNVLARLSRAGPPKIKDQRNKEDQDIYQQSTSKDPSLFLSSGRGGFRAETPARIDAVLNEVLDQAADSPDRRALKARLEAEILAAVPNLGNRALAGRWADLVAHCGMAEQDFRRVLGDVQDADRSGRLKSPGALFNVLASRAGKRFCRRCESRTGPRCPLGINYLGATAAEPDQR